MFGSLWSHYKVPAQFFLITITLLFPFSPAEANNSFLKRYSSFQSDTLAPDKDNTYFIFIAFAGRKYFSQAMKSEYIIETYRLPVTVYAELKKLTACPDKDKIKTGKKITRLLYPFNEDMKTYGIKYQQKYKQFYPKGLQTGDCINEQEFYNWDFKEPFQIMNRIWVLRAKPDSTALITYFDSIKNLNLIRQNNINESEKQKEFCYHPWDQDYIKPYRKPVLKNMDIFLSGLMKNLTKYSPYLGAQRIRLELYDNPILAAFYAEIYVHYVDSLYHVLKDSLKIRPEESERFIQETSSIIPVRFKYSSNFLLCEGICKNQFDCDNTAYFVYDLGSKLDMEVSVVLLRFHALVLVGEYAYETTGSSYFKKKDLKKEYKDVFLISSNRDSINALAAIYELSNFLAVKGEYQKAKTLVTEGLKYFPNDPQLLQTMGDVFDFLEDYANAFNCYYRANQKLPNDLYICLKLNTTRERLLSAGKKDFVLAIIKKYK